MVHVYNNKPQTSGMSRGMHKLSFLNTLKGDFQTSSVETPQFRAFHNEFKRDFKKLLEQRFGAKNIVFSKGHFYVSGFFTQPNGQIYYFSLSDVRGFKDNMLVRTAKGYKDYTGGSNQSVSLESEERFVNDLDRILMVK